MSDPLFDYRVRVSPRARNVRLRVTPQRGLEVIVPRDYDSGRVPRLLERKKEWIRTALERAEANRKFFQPEPAWRIPAQIRLPAIGKVWQITTKKTDAARVTLREVRPDQLLIFGGIHHERAVRCALLRWLMRTTRKYLMPRLKFISLKTGLHYQRGFVHRQKTRWASCSPRKSVSLNAKLLFLPPQLVDYVIAHELCHLEEMNHSKRFWRLVQSHCHVYRSRDRELREMWKSVPKWASQD